MIFYCSEKTMLIKSNLIKGLFIITAFLLTTSAQSQIADFPADTGPGDGAQLPDLLLHQRDCVLGGGDWLSV